MVQLLIDKGADILGVDSNGSTVLHHAVKGRNQAMVQLLIEKGADILARDNKGKTPMNMVRGSKKKEKRRLMELASTQMLKSRLSGEQKRPG